MSRGGSLKSSYSSHTYRESLHEKPAFYIVMFLLLATLIIGVISLVKSNQITGAATTNTIDINNFLQKLTSHDEMKSYVDVAPLNVIQINNNNFANLQAQIAGLDSTFIGSFFVQYSDFIAVYDYGGIL